MIFEEEKEKAEHIAGKVKDYLNMQAQLAKLLAVQKSGRVISSLMARMILFSIFALAAVFGSISLAWVVSVRFQSPYAGFIAITLLYLFAGLVLYIKREKWLETPIFNIFIRNVLKQEDQK